MAPPTIPPSVIEADHRLEGTATRASEKLAELRWHWTLDESNPNRVSQVAYSRAIGRSRAVVGYYARGYALFVERRTASRASARLTIEDALRLAGQSEEMQEFTEAIAEGSGKPVAQVARGDNRHRTHNIIAHARDRAERRGTDPVDEARHIAKAQRGLREAAA